MLTQQKPAWPVNLFLQGNFAPIHEEITADNLPVIGTLPPEPDGMFVRNGPNPQFPPLKHYHWFDGDGMLHGVRLQGGRASYRNRYVRTRGWQDEQLVMIAAQDFHAPPVARVRIPARVPYGFHGVWIDGELLTQPGERVADRA